MNNLFQKRPVNAQRVCKVENLNPSQGITSSYRMSRDQKRHTVVLCLADKTVKTTFQSQHSALDQMKKYRMLYKEKKVSK